MLLIFLSRADSLHRDAPPSSDYRALFVAEMRAKQLQFFERKKRTENNL